MVLLHRDIVCMNRVMLDEVQVNAYESVVGREDKLMAFLTMMTMTKH
jgi:hypothetical protein